jgi:hypothetical protein
VGTRRRESGGQQAVANLENCGGRHGLEVKQVPGS